MTEKYLEIRNLQQFYPIKKGLLKRTVGHVQAVNDVSFDIRRGETLGLVGESGCGKTTVGRTILHLIQPTGGSVTFKGRDVGEMYRQDNAELRRLMQIIFQDPYGSLNPRMNVAQIIGEAPLYHGLITRREFDDYVVDIMTKVGLRPENRAKYPHEFSGGQRQRIGVARALSVNPEFIIADEPISALDVSIQVQVVNLMKSLQKERGLTYMFIAHDLSMVKHISDRIGVMYLGNLVELTDSRKLFDNPLHPYTKALLSSIPLPDPKVERGRKRIVLSGSVKSPINLPDNCRFCSRCAYVQPICEAKVPEFREVEPGHFVACHLV